MKAASALLVGCMAVMALWTSSARAEWTVEGGSVPAGVGVEKMGAENLKFTSQLLGQTVELTATGVECASAVTACTIDEEVTEEHSKGALSFTGVTVMKPVNCSVANPGGAAGTVTTRALTGMVEMSGTGTFDRFFPQNAEGLFAEVEFTGAACPLDEAVAPINGFVYGETEATGTFLVSQPVKFNAAAGAISGLTLGTKSASLSGELTTRLTGPNAGKNFTSALARWTVVTGSVPAGVKVEKMGAENLKFTSQLLGQTIELTATGVECASAVTACAIDEEVTSGHSKGALAFTGATVMKPANCSVGNPGGAAGTVTTRALTDMLEMVVGVGSTHAFDRFFPQNAEDIFGEIEFTGAACPLDEAVAPIEGFVYGETEATGTSLVNQPLKFNAAAGSISGLTLGTRPASLSGEVTASLTGPNAGKAFYAN